MNDKRQNSGIGKTTLDEVVNWNRSSGYGTYMIDNLENKIYVDPDPSDFDEIIFLDYKGTCKKTDDHRYEVDVYNCNNLREYLEENYSGFEIM